MNLISNAIKFTENGSVKIQIRYEPNKDSIPLEYRSQRSRFHWLAAGVVNKMEFPGENSIANKSWDWSDTEMDEEAFITFLAANGKTWYRD